MTPTLALVIAIGLTAIVACAYGIWKLRADSVDEPPDEGGDMAWEYDEATYLATRTVDVAVDDDGMYRWRRRRTGPEAKVVAISGGFVKLNWCYNSAVKENYPMTVTVPEGTPAAELALTDDVDSPDSDGEAQPAS